MTEKKYWYEGLGPENLEEEAAAEARIIVDAFRGREIEIGGAPDLAHEDDDLRATGIAFMYAKDHILTREQYLGGEGGTHVAQPTVDARKQKGVLDVLQRHVTQVATRRVAGDIVLLDLNPDRGERTPDGKDESREPGDGGTTNGDRPGVLELLDLIDNEVGVGVATPDHVLTASNGVLLPCSATEPQPVYPTTGPYPAICRGGGGRVRVFVADTGLIKGAATTFPWLQGVEGDDDKQTYPNGFIRPYAGHGTFVTGVLRSMAPDAQVHVENVFDTGGSALESELVHRLDKSFGFGFEILHLTASCNTRKNIPLLALEAWLEWLRSYKGVVCVAPAGNNHTRRPSWPGAFPHVLCVGALGTDGHRRADFSNYGGWVDVYAPGEKLINAFGSGTYRYQIPPETGQIATFSGLAQWSGTSFSAPIVTGLIAARMHRCGESARDAADALLAQARAQTIPGVGPALLPSCGDGDERCGGGCDCGCGGGCHCGDGCGCGGGHGRHGGMRR